MPTATPEALAPETGSTEDLQTSVPNLLAIIENLKEAHARDVGDLRSELASCHKEISSLRAVIAEQSQVKALELKLDTCVKEMRESLARFGADASTEGRKVAVPKPRPPLEKTSKGELEGEGVNEGASAALKPWPPPPLTVRGPAFRAAVARRTKTFKRAVNGTAEHKGGTKTAAARASTKGAGPAAGDESALNG